MSFFDFPEETTKYTAKELLELPHSFLKSEAKGEYSSACPVCGGDDRFQFWPAVGNFWCRQCGLKGFVSDSPSGDRALTLAELVSGRITSQTQECKNWTAYHYNCLNNEFAMRYWERELGPKYHDAVIQFNLGYCDDYKGLGGTMTIPVGYLGKIYLIKHRLLKPAKEKYMTEPKGVGALLFNLDAALTAREVIITEGEKKAMRLWLEGYAAISSTVGAQGFQKEWDIFLTGKKVTIIFDPDDDGQKAAKNLAERLGAVTLVLPDKVDDWINAGGNIQEVLGHELKTVVL